MIVLDIDPVIFSLGPLQFRWYGLSYVVGFLLGKMLVRNIITDSFFSSVRKKLISFFDFFEIWIFISIVLGGRIGYFLFYMKKNQYDLYDILKITNGGMSFHGALIFSLFTTIIFAKYKNICYVLILDLISIVAPIGIFLGRIANFINQELYGHIVESNVPWAVIFSNVDCFPRHPSQLYEALLEGITLFCIMWFSYKNLKLIRIQGALVSIFAIFYSVFRIICEFFRLQVDEKLILYNISLTKGQLLCIATLIILFVYHVFSLSRKNFLKPRSL